MIQFLQDFFFLTYGSCFLTAGPFFFYSRCQWINHCLPSPGAAWRMLSVSGRSGGLEKNVPVLVRRERDGFYYRGTVKEEIEVSDSCSHAGVCNRVCVVRVKSVHLQEAAGSSAAEVGEVSVTAARPSACGKDRSLHTT